jgi:hypothetical protein
MVNAKHLVHWCGVLDCWFAKENKRVWCLIVASWWMLGWLGIVIVVGRGILSWDCGVIRWFLLWSCCGSMLCVMCVQFINGQHFYVWFWTEDATGSCYWIINMYFYDFDMDVWCQLICLWPRYGSYFYLFFYSSSWCKFASTQHVCSKPFSYLDQCRVVTPE